MIGKSFGCKLTNLPLTRSKLSVEEGVYWNWEKKNRRMGWKILSFGIVGLFLHAVLCYVNKIFIYAGYKYIGYASQNWNFYL